MQAKARAAAEAAARRAAAGLPASPQAGGAAPSRPRGGSPLDAVAVLTAAGAAAIAGGRGLPAGGAAPAEETLDGDEVGAASAAASAAEAAAAAAAAVGISAAADVAAALPLPSAVRESQFQRREDFVRLHAIKRRLWEQHNMVLGRQESFSLRTQKRSLNLSTTGTTTADDIRASGRDGASSGSYSAAGDRRPEAVSVAAEAEAAGGGGGSGGSSGLWGSRAAVDRGLDTVLALQDSARVLLGMLRATGGAPPAATLAAKREEVAALRRDLAGALGCGEAAHGAGTAAAAAALPPVDSPADAALLALLSLPKGKKLLVRAGPMLAAPHRAQLCGAGLRRLPHFVASNAAGREAEEADAAAAAALADWVGSGPAGVVGGGRDGGAPPGEALATLAEWGAVLFECHAGATLRALLGHPGASGVISALLSHGEAQRATGEDAIAEGRLPAEALAAVEAAVAKWKDVTDKLGRAYMEAESA